MKEFGWKLVLYVLLLSAANMDAKEIVHLAQQLEKASADGGFNDILTLLGDLDQLKVTSEQLETTHLVKVLHGLLKTCPDVGVKKAVKNLLSRLKRKYGKEKRGANQEVGEAVDRAVSNQEEAPGSAQPCRAEEAKDAGSTPASFSSVRSKCVQLLLASFCHETPEDKAAELARDIEHHVHDRHRSSQVKYKACIRSKVANLRNPKNKHLQQGLLTGSLSPEAFAGMSAEEMADAELRQLREEYSSRGVSERQLPRGLEGTQTHKIHCKNCGGSDCRVTQVSRGALFLPAWVRRGSPDEDAMTFVTCSGCGQQWYHSGWVCF